MTSIAALCLFKVEHNLEGRWTDAGWESDDEPLRFESEAEGVTAITGFVAESKEGFERGDLHAPYHESNFRVVPV